ncbi:MAG: FtsX-like permease family protein [Gammaproteobacteria bacterium]
MATLPGSGAVPAGWHFLCLAAWRYAKQHPWQTWLSFLGIALGVMMVVAVDLANGSARRAFAQSIDAVNGNITHQIVGGSAGVPDAVYTALRTELGLRRSAPTLSAAVRIEGQEFTLLGLDLVSEASLDRRRPGFSTQAGDLLVLGFASLAAGNAVLMSDNAAQALQLADGARFTLQSGAGAREVELAATFASGEAAATDGLVFADIATAQDLLQRCGTLDSIDLVLSETEAERLRAWLPAGLTLVETNARNASLEQMTAAFHVNLLAMSLLALLVAGLLIYNTVSLSVLQRQETLGILRSLGVTRGELVKLVLGEAAVLGMLASAAGVVAGLLLGQALVQLVTRTIDDLYFDLTVTRFMLEPLSLLKGFALGVGLTLLAAALPAWEAGRSQPVTLRQRAVRDRGWMQRLPLLACAGLVLLGAGYLLLIPAQGSLAGGFVALNLIIFGFCLMLPLAMYWLLQGVLRAAGLRMKQTVRLSLRNLQTGIGRTGLAVAALAVSVSVTVGVGIMVGSFRDTVILWLDQTLSGDLQVTRLDDGGIPQELQDYVMALPDVNAVVRGYQLRAESSRGPVRVMATDAAVTESLFIKELDDADLARIEAGEGLLVSEPFAYTENLAIGSTLSLTSARGTLELPVLGIFYDYSTGAGMVAVAEQVLLREWPGQAPTRLTLQLTGETGAVANTLRREAARHAGSYGIAANADIRRITLTIFDRTFAITHVLRLLAIVVAFVGVLSALIALQLERMREYAMLRAAGMTAREVAAMIAAQTLVLGLLAGLFALPLGLMMSDILIDVINRRSFGWSMLHTLPPNVLIEALLLAVGAALIAGLYPMRRVARVRPAEALRGE